MEVTVVPSSSDSIEAPSDLSKLNSTTQTTRESSEDVVSATTHETQGSGNAGASAFLSVLTLICL